MEQGPDVRKKELAGQGEAEWGLPVEFGNTPSQAVRPKIIIEQPQDVTSIATLEHEEGLTECKEEHKALANSQVSPGCLGVTQAQLQST
ncbi:hypothetical protein NDU88_000155 [Pleurodeles waltl]|uniref:Uncharacterized protein n=1 Tax=Pleurodeles waltl TaxID=8319 RepID=A0AAV7TFU8_PLEWA|nr:hypothetical protein NDU88_000155 [Pleurodeles waltl]